MKCDRCDEDAVYLRKYSGERLCKVHFARAVERKIYRGLREGLEDSRKVGVAVSGRRGSLVLARMVKRTVNRAFRGMNLVGLVLDEGISGYRERTISRSVSFLSRLKIDFKILRFSELFNTTIDDLASRGVKDDICIYCEALKRRALEGASRSEDLDAILIGYDANDVACNVLLSVIRGTPDELLRFWKLGGARVVAPLKTIPKEEVRLYASMRGINGSGGDCPRLKASLKGEVCRFLDELEKRRSGSLFSIIRLAERATKVISTELEVGRCELCGEPSTRSVCGVCGLIKDLSVGGDLG